MTKMNKFVDREAVDLIDTLLTCCNTKTDQGKNAWWILMNEKKKLVEEADSMTLKDATALVLVDLFKDWKPKDA